MFSFGLNKFRKRPKKPIRKVVVVLGDRDSGKTCLLTSICLGPFTKQPSEPEVFGPFVADLIFDGVEMEILPWDICDRIEVTSHPHHYISYLDASAILLCFSIDSQRSLQNVETRWLPHLKLFRPDDVPTILIGNKKDLRDEHQSGVDRATIDFVTHEKGAEIATKIGAFAYIECPAKTMEGIDLVFPTAVTAMRPPAEKWKSFQLFIKSNWQNVRCVVIKFFSKQK